MRTMTEQEMREVAEAAVGATIFVSYVAGREPTARACEEARPHTEDPARPRRYLFGELTSVWQNRHGEWCLTLFAENRDTVRNGIRFEGGFRTINPQLGQLVVLEVIRPAA
jgi:hypothetical protein